MRGFWHEFLISFCLSTHTQDDPKHYHDPKRVIECLQRSVKTADMCMASSQHVNLFVEVLNHYIYFYENGCPTITEKYVSALVAFINDKKGEAGIGEVSK